MARTDGRRPNQLRPVTIARHYTDFAPGSVLMTGAGQLVEVQGSGESATFTRGELDNMLTLAARGIRQLQKLQRETLGPSATPPKRPTGDRSLS